MFWERLNLRRVNMEKIKEVSKNDNNQEEVKSVEEESLEEAEYNWEKDILTVPDYVITYVFLAKKNGKSLTETIVYLTELTDDSEDVLGKAVKTYLEENEDGFIVAWKVKSDERLTQGAHDYYYIDPEFKVERVRWTDSEKDNTLLKSDNYFHDLTSAVNEAERREVISQIKLFSTRPISGQKNYFMVYDSESDTFSYDYRTDTFSLGTIFFDSVESIMNVVDFVGLDKIRKHVLGEGSSEQDLFLDSFPQDDGN